MAVLSHSLDCVAESIGRGEADAFDRLYDRVADRLFRFAFRFLSDREDAEDAVQQAFLELAQSAGRPDNGRSLEAWLFASVRYTCIDLLRRRSRRPEVPQEQLPEVDGEDQYQLGVDPSLERALASLTDAQRQIIHLKYVEGLDGQQIADIMDTNRVAVYAMSGRAERRLKNLLIRIDSGRTPKRKGFKGD
ncbi:MAG: RNA polymerase sigma factor [Acidimicrobiales bacterium]